MGRENTEMLKGMRKMKIRVKVKVKVKVEGIGKVGRRSI